MTQIIIGLISVPRDWKLVYKAMLHLISELFSINFCLQINPVGIIRKTIGQLNVDGLFFF